MSALSKPRFQWILYSCEFVLGAAFLVLFWWLEFRVIRVFLLLFGVGLVVCNFFRLFDRFAFQLPDVLCNQLGSSTGITLAAVFVLFNTNRVVVLALGWLILLYGLLSFYSVLTRLVGNALLFAALRRMFEQGLSARPTRKGRPVALIYVLAERGIGSFYANRLSAKLTRSLMRHRRERLAVFLSSAALTNYSDDFRRWLAAQSAALLIVGLPADLADQDFEPLVTEYCALTLGNIFRVTLRPGNDQASENAYPPYQTALYSNISTIDFDSITQHKAIATLTDQMAMSTFAIVDGDFRLSDALRRVILLIATQGLPPIANSYLRFRLAQSDVERFLCLLDCIEATVKCSVIALLTTQWQTGDTSNNALISEKLHRPSLGHWIEMLRTLVKRQPQSNFQKQIADFWSQPQVEAPKKLIDDVNGSGLSWNGVVPRSHLHWLDWFSWLRNVTRGHGVVKEAFVANFWQGFHDVFLRMVLGLEGLTLCTRFLRPIPVNQLA